MKHISLILALLLSSTTAFGQAVVITAPADTSPQSVPLGSELTISASVQGDIKTGITWSTSGGTLHGTNPCLQSPCTISLYSATAAGPFTVTATQTGGSASATQQVTFTASPSVVTGHPKLLLTPSLVSSMQTKCATGTNLACNALRAAAIHDYGVTIAAGDGWGFTYSCNGGTDLPSGTPSVDAWEGNFYEVYANEFAWMSLMYPTDPTYNWGCYYRALWNYTKYGVQSGHLVITSGNQWSQAAREFALTPDWGVATGANSSVDISDTRGYLAYHAATLLNLNAQGTVPTYDHTQWGTYQLFTGVTDGLTYQRGMGSNYTEGKFLEILNDAITFDDNTTDDPNIPQNGAVGVWIASGGSSWAVGDQFHIASGGGVGQVTSVSGGVAEGVELVSMGSAYGSTSGLSTTAISPSVGTGLTVDINLGNTCGATRYVLCSDFTGGSLHAYLAYWSQTYLPKEYAHLEDSAVVIQALNTAYPSGGFSSIPNCSWPSEGGFSANVTCFGDAIGGESAEGAGYWSHIAFPRYALDELSMVGLADPRSPSEGGPYYGGPQMSLVNSSYWDQTLWASRNFMVNFGANGQATSPGFTAFSTGDMNHYVFYPLDWQNISALYLYDGLIGRTDRNNAELWILFNSAYGQALGTADSCTNDCGFDKAMTIGLGQDIAYDIATVNPNADPTGGTLPTDPGANYPTALYVGGYNQHQTLRSGYSASSAIVSIYGANSLIDHEHTCQGCFDVMQNGESFWKGRVEFDNDYNDAMNAAVNRNGATYINTGGTYAHCAGDQQGPAILYGGQFIHGYQVPPPNTALHSEGPVYAAYSIVDTNAYNGCNDGGPVYDDITGASRDILTLLSANQILTYDRGASTTANDKAAWFTVTGTVTVTGNQACWPTRSTSQKGCTTALLPTGVNPSAQKLIQYTSITAPHSTLQSGTTMQMTCTAHYADGTTADISASPIVNWQSDSTNVTISTSGLATAAGSIGSFSDIGCFPYNIYTQVAVTVGSASSGSIAATGEQTQLQDPEPFAQVVIDAGGVNSTQILALHQWGSSSLTPVSPTLVQSSAGQGYDGALVGTSLGIFMRTLAPFTGTTYAASGATAHYVYNTTPNTLYTITGAGTPGSATSDNAGVLAFAATGTGNITVGAPLVAAPSNLQGVVCVGCNVH